MRSLASTVTITLGANQYREARDAALRTCRDIGKEDRTRIRANGILRGDPGAEMSPLLRYAARSPTPGELGVKNRVVELLPELLQNIVSSLPCRKNPIP